MLTRCERCSNLFDTDKTDGVCPICGLYQSGPANVDKRDVLLRYELGRSFLDWLQNPEHLLAGSIQMINWEDLRRRTALLAALFWLLLLISGALWYEWQDTRWENSGYAGQIFTHQLNSSLFSHRGRPVRVGEMELSPKQYPLALPEDHQLVRVPLRIRTASCEDTDWADAVYLQVQLDGNPQYYPPLPGYQMQQQAPRLAQNALYSIHFCFHSASDGWLYFAIPRQARDPQLYVEIATQEETSAPRQISEVLLIPLKTAGSEVLPLD